MIVNYDSRDQRFWRQKKVCTQRKGEEMKKMEEVMIDFDDPSAEAITKRGRESLLVEINRIEGRPWRSTIVLLDFYQSGYIILCVRNMRQPFGKSITKEASIKGTCPSAASHLNCSNVLNEEK